MNETFTCPSAVTPPPALAQTGPPIVALFVIGFLLVGAGTALLWSARRRGGGVVVPLLLAIAAVVVVEHSTPRAEAATCPPAASASSSSSPTAASSAASATPTSTVTTMPESTPPPSPTTTPPPPPACPLNGDLSTLPAGDTIAWSPIHVPDPRDEPNPADGETVIVWNDNISGYTWHIVRGSDGSVSADCGGIPNDGTACVADPGASYSAYTWVAGSGQWIVVGSGGSDGCSGSGGNNGAGGNNGGGGGNDGGGSGGNN